MQVSSENRKRDRPREAGLRLTIYAKAGKAVHAARKLSWTVERIARRLLHSLVAGEFGKGDGGRAAGQTGDADGPGGDHPGAGSLRGVIAMVVRKVGLRPPECQQPDGFREFRERRDREERGCRGVGMRFMGEWLSGHSHLARGLASAVRGRVKRVGSGRSRRTKRLYFARQITIVIFQGA